jgi:hypothetical protein
VNRTIREAVIVALLALVALWAFVSSLHPAFTGELAEALLRCN